MGTNLANPATFSMFVETLDDGQWRSRQHVSGCSLGYCLNVPALVGDRSRLIAMIYDDTEGGAADPVLYGERKAGDVAVVWTTLKPSRG